VGAFKALVDKINELIWGYPMIFLLVATHVYLTFKLKFIQKYIFKAIKLSVKKDNSAGMVSNFGALSVSLAATVGTGSIIGMSTAIATGGPGAVFWMIVIGIFGIATKYAECMLAVKYRVKNEAGEQVGGPMYIMRNVLKMKRMGAFFAFCGLLMALSGGGMLQVNAIADVLGDAYRVNGVLVGAVAAALVCVVILGGVKSIAAVCEWLVPFMGTLYLLAALAVFVLRIEAVPGAVFMIFKEAFRFKAAGGGLLGAGVMAAMYAGASRSVLTTEAGLGSASVVAAAARSKNPVRQGLVASTSVFWTFFVCTLTGLIILIAGDWQSGTKFAGDLCNSAFSAIPYAGILILVVSLTIFSFTTIIGWTYYGERFIEFLGGHRFVVPFRVFWIICMFFGALISTQLAWSLAVLVTALMAVPNLVMIFLLRNDIVKETDEYLKQEVSKL
jgi:AGCS family alanine or glycine:cation symporter